MFTESVWIGCCFLACQGGSVKYQTCLIFHRLSMTLYPNLDSAHLATVQRWISMACQSHLPSCPILLLSCLEELKGNQPVINITKHSWLHPVNTLSYQVFNHSNISAGQGGNTS